MPLSASLVILSTVCLLFLSHNAVYANRNFVNMTSRAKQHFSVNCNMNLFLKNEFTLALEYLNASMFMRQDTVALHGFGKMFTQLWREQSDSVNKIRSFIVHRGGSVDTPGHIFKSSLRSMNYFANETLIVHKFLHLEENSNRMLLQVHKASSEKSLLEQTCLDKYEKPSELRQGQVRDRVSAQFIDENFARTKLKRIEFLAHLMRQITRLDMHPTHISGVKHMLNQIGIHMIDNELRQKF